jgi:hypothetical protein
MKFKRKRQFAQFKKAAMETNMQLEHKESAIEEEIATRRRVEKLKNEEIERLTEEHAKAQARLENNLLQFERQVTDLRERLKALMKTNEELGNKLSAAEKELQEIRSKQGGK